MDTFKEYLQDALAGLAHIEEFKTIHIILGNESCDLDSTVSTLLLGFMLYVNVPRSNTLVLPVMNVNQEDYLLRTENCYVLNKCGIDLKKLIYRPSLPLEMMLKHSSEVGTEIFTHLVDHHILSKKDSELEKTVIEIIDHRPRDLSCSWDQYQNVNITIEEVGSCATLVANNLFKLGVTLDKPLAFLLYQTIIYDTIALLPENGKAKSLDIEVAGKLEDKFNFGVERKALFDELWTAHNNVSHLTPRQLLSKDMKIVDGVPVPGLPMLVEDYIKLPDASVAIEQLSKEYNSDLIILIGLDAKQEVKRDIGVYCRNDKPSSNRKTVKDIFIDNLKNSSATKNLDFDLVEREVSCDNLKCFRQANTKLSRKQIIPILKESIIEYNHI